MDITVGVLGPVAAWSPDGTPVALRGPRHREVLARLAVARGRVVPLSVLVDDLWDDPPSDPVGALRTFVAALRRAVEPDRPPRAAAQVLVTDGPGYALRLPTERLDATRFEAAVGAARGLPPEQALAVLEEAATWWRGPAYADVVDAGWARAEAARLTELRLQAVELAARARLDTGRAAAAVPDLDAHVVEHPWREEGWRLLALALYRTGRQGDALDVLRRARTMLLDRLGVDPGPGLHRLEADILRQVAHPTVGGGPEAAVGGAWARATAVYDRQVATGSPARLRTTMDLLRSLAVTGGDGLVAAREQRLAAVLAAEQSGDPELTARIIGAYDVPAIWSRADDQRQAEMVVAAAERTLRALGPEGPDPLRARLLATIATESRGSGDPRAAEAARQAEEIARRLHDPAVLAFALNGAFMQSFERAGLAARRADIGAELVTLSSRHGLVTSELLGHLIRMQALAATGDVPGADEHASQADRLAARHESPLVGVFTGWYRAMRLALTGAAPTDVALAYRRAAAALDGAGMPGMSAGLLPLALLTLRVRHDRPAPTDARIDWGPFEPWARPLVLLARGDHDDAALAVAALPDPPHDHLLEALWCLAAHAALAVGDGDVMGRALAALLPAEGEEAGAGSGVLTLGPVRGFTRALQAALAT